MAKYKIIPSSRAIVQSPISIGHKKEKGVEAIEFDLTAWVETYGSGTATIIMCRWGDAIPYPVALELDENNKATWTLSDIDTAKAGMAYAQLNYIVGDEVVKKSDIYTFRVMDSLTGEGEPPEAYESWLEHLTHLAAEAMAEVLDIEGIVTDKTLTVDGGIADAKAVGDELTGIKADLDAQVADIKDSQVEFNAIDILRNASFTNKTSGGAQYTWNGKTCVITGIVTGTSYNRIYYNASGLPDGMVAGGTYYLISNSSDNNKVFIDYHIYDINGDVIVTGNTKYDSENVKEIVLPIEAVGFDMRLRASTSDGLTINETIEYGGLLQAPSNKMLLERINESNDELTGAIDGVDTRTTSLESNAFQYKQVVPSGTDINTIVDRGLYSLSSGQDYVNSPVASGFLFVQRTGNSAMQLVYRYGTNTSFIPNVFYRCAVINTNNPSFTSEWRRIDNNRKTPIKMAFFGASETYGTNGDTKAQVEEQYRLPSIIAHNLGIEVTNYGVGSQGYLGLATSTQPKAYDNISSKDLSQFNTMVMLYGGNDGFKPLGTGWDDTDEETIMGQFHKIVNYVYTQNPTIRLIVISPLNGRNLGTFPKYWYGPRNSPDGYVSRQTLSDTLKEACEYYNIPYIEQTNCPLNGFTMGMLDEDHGILLGKDGVHLTLEGYKRVGEWLSGELRRIIG